MPAQFAGKWGTGKAFKASSVRDRLVKMVAREPGISQAEAARRLGWNISSTVTIGVRRGALRRELRLDRHNAYALFPTTADNRPINGDAPRPNPAMLPWRQRDVLELMTDAGAELAINEIVDLVRQREPSTTYPAVRGPVVNLHDRHCLKGRTHRGRYLYRPVRNALQRLDVLFVADW